jgi:hypothetical protein
MRGVKNKSENKRENKSHDRKGVVDYVLKIPSVQKNG